MAQKKEAKVVKVSGNQGRKLFMLPYTRINYILMAVGCAVIVLGFMLMSGGQQSGDTFNPDEVYSARRITVAPITVLIGFVIEVVAIMWLPKSKASNATA